MGVSDVKTKQTKKLNQISLFRSLLWKTSGWCGDDHSILSDIMHLKKILYLRVYIVKTFDENDLVNIAGWKKQIHMYSQPRFRYHIYAQITNHKLYVKGDSWINNKYFTHKYNGEPFFRKI